jgi:DNA-binding beta-propeller fold protein YncE
MVGLAVVAGMALPAGAMAFGPVSSFGSWGEGPGQFRPEGGIAIGPNSHTYVADTGNGRIDEFGPDGAFVRSFGELSEPMGIAVAGDGEVYVAERGGGKVTVFSGEGAFVREIGEPGEGAGKMAVPTGVALDPASGNVFVADAQLNRVDVFTPTGTFVRAFGKEVAISGGGDVCDVSTGCKEGKAEAGAGAFNSINGLAFAPGSGRLYVADYYNERIDVFTPGGEFLFAFGFDVTHVENGGVCEAPCFAGGEVEDAGSVSGPLWLAFDREGSLHISSLPNQRIDVFTPAGAFVHAYGQGVVDGSPNFQICITVCRKGTIDPTPRSGSVLIPRGLAVDCGGSVEVLEVEDQVIDEFARIERFGEFSSPVPPCEEKEPVRVILRKTAHPRLRISIHLNRKRGTATALIRTGGTTGSLKLRGPHIHHVFRRQIKSPRCLPDRGCHLVHLVIRATGRAKQQLNETGTTNVHFSITFNPPSSAPLTKARDLTLRKRR